MGLVCTGATVVVTDTPSLGTLAAAGGHNSATASSSCKARSQCSLSRSLGLALVLRAVAPDKVFSLKPKLWFAAMQAQAKPKVMRERRWTSC